MSDLFLVQLVHHLSVQLVHLFLVQLTDLFLVQLTDFFLVQLTDLFFVQLTDLFLAQLAHLFLTQIVYASVVVSADWLAASSDYLTLSLYSLAQNEREFVEFLARLRVSREIVSLK